MISVTAQVSLYPLREACTPVLRSWKRSPNFVRRAQRLGGPNEHSGRR